MFTIDTFSITFIIKVSELDFIPIQFYSTKLKNYGPFFIGDIIIPNRVLQLDPLAPLLDINYTINSKKYKKTLMFTYDQDQDAWCFLSNKTIIKYEVYNLAFPFSLTVEIALNKTPCMKKYIQVNNNTSKIILPSGTLITAKILESNYLIKVNNVKGPFVLDLKAINGKSIKKISLTSQSSQAFISGKQGSCLSINEINLTYGDLVEKIILNKFEPFSSYEGFFVGGTQIKTSTGFQPIEAIKTGTKLVNQRNRQIEVISVNSWVSSWVDNILFKGSEGSEASENSENNEKIAMYYHKNTKTLCSDGVLRPILSQKLPLATKKEICNMSNECVCYALELNSVMDKILLTGDKAADNIRPNKPPKQLFINIYSRKYIREL